MCWSRLLFRPGPSYRIVAKWLDDGALEAVVCPALLAEVEGVLDRPRLRKRGDPGVADLFLATVRRIADVVADPASVVAETRDPNLNGRICNIAYQDGFEATINFGPVLMKRLVLTATTLRARTAEEKRSIRDAVQTQFWDAVGDGTIRPVLDTAFPMDQVEQAHQRLASGGHIGKIVLTRSAAST